jgi:hypothetical protein
MRRRGEEPLENGDVVVYVGDDIPGSVRRWDRGVLHYVDSNSDAHVRWDDHGVAIVPAASVRREPA